MHAIICLCIEFDEAGIAANVELSGFGVEGPFAVYFLFADCDDTGFIFVESESAGTFLNAYF